MQSLTELQQLLENQFGSFIREGKYKRAFDRAMTSLQKVEAESPRIDVFYLFLHHLVLELFDEIDRLHNLLNDD